MRERLGFFVLLCAASVGLAAVAEAAKIVSITGDVRVKGPGAAAAVVAAQDQEVAAGTEIACGPQARCTVALDEALLNTATVKENTTLTLEELEPGRLFLKEGRVFSIVRQAAGGASFQVRTPTSISGARGTAWLTDFRTGRTEVSVFEDEVLVSGLDAAGNMTDEIDVATGQGVSVAADGLLGEIFVVPVDQINEWHAEKQGLESLRKARGLPDLPVAREEGKRKGPGPEAGAPPPTMGQGAGTAAGAPPADTTVGPPMPDQGPATQGGATPDLTMPPPPMPGDPAMDDGTMMDEPMADDGTMTNEPMMPGDPAMDDGTMMDDPMMSDDPAMDDGAIMDDPMMPGDPAMDDGTMMDDPMMSDDPMMDDPMMSDDAAMDDPMMDDPMMSDDPMMDDPMMSDDPMMDDPMMDDPMMDDPMMDDPMMNDPMLDDPMMTDPMFDDPMFDDPMMDPEFHEDITDPDTTAPPPPPPEGSDPPIT
jgi:hypothetical protein